MSNFLICLPDFTRQFEEGREDSIKFNKYLQRNFALFISSKYLEMVPIIVEGRKH